MFFEIFLDLRACKPQGCLAEALQKFPALHYSLLFHSPRITVPPSLAKFMETVHKKDRAASHYPMQSAPPVAQTFP